MSWIFAYIGPHTREREAVFKSISNKTLFASLSEKIFIAAGGNPQTCFFNGDSNKGWIVNGVGIQDNIKILQQDEWNQYISNNDHPLAGLDGHHLILTWDASNINIQTDVLGVRKGYLFKHQDEIFFSTHIDFISRFIKLQFDFFQLGSRWLSVNQAGQAHPVKGIQQLGSGTMHVDLTTLHCEVRQHLFLPQMNECDHPVRAYSEKLFKLIQMPSANHLTTSFSLSGGMDSRLILSCLL